MADTTCSACGTEVASGLLACPSCRALVHAARLKELAAAADAAERAGDLGAALGAWREALALLPGDTRQHAIVARAIEGLSARVPAGAPTPDAPGWSWLAKGGPVAAVGLVVWKVWANAKLALLGLGKLSTILSMGATLLVYWAMFGWWFALGLILSIYIHEMGHVAALRRLGIAATAPMFIPGLGAFVRLKQYPATPAEDARVGLAGPVWGLGAALLALAAHRLGIGAVALAVARTGAWINLFNLLPIGQLDGGRGMRALSRPQRWILTLVTGAAAYVTGEGMVILVGLVIAGRTLFERAPETGDRRALITFSGLVAALSALSALHVG